MFIGAKLLKNCDAKPKGLRQYAMSAGYGVGKGRVVHLQQWMVSAEGWEKDGAQIAVFCYSG